MRRKKWCERVVVVVVVGGVAFLAVWRVVGDDAGSVVEFVDLAGEALPGEGLCRPSWRELMGMTLLLRVVVVVVVAVRSPRGDASDCAVDVEPSARGLLPAM